MPKLPVESSGFYKAADFDAGLYLKVRKDAEYKDAENFGDATTGKSYFYFFETLEDEPQEMEFQNNSKRLARAWNDVDPQVGDIVFVKGTGSGMKREYEVRTASEEEATI